MVEKQRTPKLPKIESVVAYSDEQGAGILIKRVGEIYELVGADKDGMFVSKTLTSNQYQSALANIARNENHHASIMARSRKNTPYQKRVYYGTKREQVKLEDME